MSSFYRRRDGVLAAMAVLLSGCTLGPDFVEPNAHLPDNTT